MNASRNVNDREEGAIVKGVQHYYCNFFSIKKKQDQVTVILQILHHILSDIQFNFLSRNNKMHGYLCFLIIETAFHRNISQNSISHKFDTSIRKQKVLHAIRNFKTIPVLSLICKKKNNC